MTETTKSIVVLRDFAKAPNEIKYDTGSAKKYKMNYNKEF